MHNFSNFLSWIDARKINLQSTNTKVPLWCQPITASAERSFSMLDKLLAKNRNLLPQNVKHYMSVHYSLSTRQNWAFRFFHVWLQLFSFYFYSFIKVTFWLLFYKNKVTFSNFLGYKKIALVITIQLICFL